MPVRPERRGVWRLTAMVAGAAVVAAYALLAMATYGRVVGSAVPHPGDTAQLATSGQMLVTNDWSDRLGPDGYWRARRNGGASPGSAFGAWIGPPSPRYQPPAGLLKAPPASQWGPPSHSLGGGKRPVSRKDKDRDDDEDTASNGGYRTVCVRLCDGYYWPISFATAKDNFARDARTCEKSCGMPARLFVHENPGQEPELMEDLKGKRYKDLKVAFLHRTNYNAACTCKPHPWEEAALARHRQFAEAADRRKKGAGGKVAAVSAKKPAAIQPAKKAGARAATAAAVHSASKQDGASGAPMVAGKPMQSQPARAAAAEPLAPPQTLFRGQAPARGVRFPKQHQTKLAPVQATRSGEQADARAVNPAQPPGPARWQGQSAGGDASVRWIPQPVQVR